MSLLAQINERNNAQGQNIGNAAQQEEAEAGKPDAVATARQQRADYSAANAGGQDKDMMEEEATPEEQAIFTKLEKQLAEYVYGRESSMALVDAVMSAGDPVEGIGLVANDMVSMLAQQNPNTPDEVLAGLGESAVEQTVDMLEKTKPEINLSDDQIAEAYSLAVKTWMEAHPDDVDPDMQSYLEGDAPAQIAPQGQPSAPQSPMAQVAQGAM